MVGPFNRDSEHRPASGGGRAQRPLEPWERDELIGWLEERRLAALPEFDRALARLETSGAASPSPGQSATPRSFVPVRFGPRQPGVGGAGREGANARAPALSTDNRGPMYIFPDGRLPALSGNDPFSVQGRSRSAQPAARPRGQQPWERMAEMMRARPAPTEPDPMIGRLARQTPSRVPPGVSIDPNGAMSVERLEGMYHGAPFGGGPLRSRRIPATPEQQQSAIESMLDADSFRQGVMSPQERVARAAGLNWHGYEPAPGDPERLARIMFSESASIPDDYEAIGWATVNRVGQRRYGQTLDEVLRKKGAFEIVREGGGPPGDSALYNRSARAHELTGPNRTSWERAQRVADGILSGDIPDPTDGATMFFASTRYNGTPKSAEGDFRRMLREGGIRPSPYETRARGRNRQYFFIEDPPGRR